MSVDEKYLQLVDRIVTVSIADKTRIIGIAGIHDDSGVTGLSGVLAEAFVLTGTKTLLANLSGNGRPGLENRKSWLSVLEIPSTFIGEDPAGFDCMEIHLDQDNRFVFNNMAKVRKLIDENLGDYETIIFDLPGILSRHPETINAASCAAVCDSVYLMCRTGETTRPDLAMARERLDDVHAPLKGVILNDVDHVTTGQGMARQVQRLGWVPGMKSLASRLENMEFLN